MIRKKTLTGLLTVLMLSCSAAFGTPHIIIFGDSLSDSGNNDWVKTSGKTGAPITNRDPQTATHPLWINHLTHIHPSKHKQVDPATQSVNYAYASAETGNHYLNDISDESFPPYVDNICSLPGKLNTTTACVPGVAKQIQIYLDAVHHPTPGTIFILWAGGNDILNNITKTLSFFSRQGMKKVSAVMLQPLMDTPPDGKKYTLREVLPDLSDPIVNLYLAKEKLIAAGAKPEQIYVINLPDLSKAPAGINLADGNPAVLQAIHTITRAFNEGLALALTGNPLSDNNLPANHILSVYDLLNEVIANPEKYHMTHIAESCVADQKTPDCTGYIFFDNKHPTVATGKIIAEWIARMLQAE